MKILIVDNMFGELEQNMNSVGGFERRNLTDAYLLAASGEDEVFFTHAGPKFADFVWKSFPFKPVRLHDYPAEHPAVESPAKWRNLVRARCLKWISANQPDVVLFGSNTMMTLAKEIVKTTPVLVHVASFLTTNCFIDSGRMTSFLQISKEGGFFVFNTEGTHQIFMDQAREMSVKLATNENFAAHKKTFKFFTSAESFADMINAHNMGVGLVGRRDGDPLREDKGYAIVASRADPAKLVHKFAKSTIPLRIFWKTRASSNKKDYLTNNVKAFEANPNIRLELDAPYSKIMRAFAGARCCLVSWPDETYGLTAFEAASFGVPSIVFKRQPDSINCTEEFLSRVYKPKIVAYNSKTWKADLEAHFNKLAWSHEKRQRLAETFADVYSQDNYLNEKRLALRKAIRKWKKIHS